MVKLHKYVVASAATVVFGLLGGCGQKFQHVQQTLELAFYGMENPQKTAQEIEALPYASVYVQLESGPRAFVLLALAEAPQRLSPHSALTQDELELKWISIDGAMIATQAGRVVRTAQLPSGNLVSTISQDSDPLALGLQLTSTPKTWQRHIDWQPGYHFGYEVNSSFSLVGNESIDVNHASVDSLHFVENVAVEKLDVTYTNHFWLDPTSGAVIKSHQKIAPNLPYVDITILKPFSS